MVGDDDVDAEVGGRGHFGGVAHTAIGGDDDAYALTVQALDRWEVEAVALGHTVRDVGDRPGAQARERLDEESRGGDAIGIEVAVHGDGLTRPHRLDQASDSGLRAGDLRGPAGIVRLGVEKRFGVGGRPDAPVVQKLGHQRRVAA